MPATRARTTEVAHVFGPASELYHVEQEPGELTSPVLLHALTGFIDAGHAGRLAVEHLLEHLESRVVARFDVDQLLDYRSRRPVMTFESDHWAGYAPVEMTLRVVRDEQGMPFLLLTGAEPDLQWERFTAAVIELVERFGVRLTVGLTAVPMAVPHTRRVTVTAHATRPELVADYERWFGTVQAPGSASALLELRLGEAGHDAAGFAVHVPHYLARAEYPDSARGLLEHAARTTGLSLPVDALRATAQQVLAQVDEQVGRSEEVAAVVRALEEQFDATVGAAGRRSLPALQADELPTAEEIGAELEQFLAEQDGGAPPPG